MLKSKFLQAGQKYGKLKIINLHHVEKKKVKNKTRIINRNYEYYLCKCDCGKECIVIKNSLTNGLTRSCGCLQKDILRTIHTNNKKLDNLYNTRLHRIWSNMKTRCFNKNFSQYKDYGGRGIKVCEEWNNDFINFYNWAINNGYQENLSIDRINVNGNYEPNNCRWLTIQEQNNNKRDKNILYNNKLYNITEFCKIKNISRTTYYKYKRMNLLYKLY